MTPNMIRKLGSLLAVLTIGFWSEARAQVTSNVTDTSASRKVFFYNGRHGSAATGEINPDLTFTTLQPYDQGVFGQWTHVVEYRGDLVFYNYSNGWMTHGYVDVQGFFHGDASAGWVGSNWDTIVEHRGYLLLYNSQNGLAVVGEFREGTFRSYNSWYFSPGWTSIVSTTGGLLFYNRDSGAGAVGDLQINWIQVDVDTFPVVASIDFVPLSQPGFLTGWTHIVQTSNGILFYCSVNGATVMADISAEGIVSTRDLTWQTIDPGYTAITAVDENILFYKRAHGDVAIGRVRPFDLLGGALTMAKVYPAYFSPGWSRIATTIDPPSIH